MNIWSFEPDKRSPTSSFTDGSCIGRTIARSGTEREHQVTQTHVIAAATDSSATSSR